MAPTPKSKLKTTTSSSQFLNIAFDDDDFQEYPSPSLSAAPRTSSLPRPLKLYNLTAHRSSKTPRKRKPVSPGKENRIFDEAEPDLGCGLDSIEPTLDLLNNKGINDCTRTDNLTEPQNLEPIAEEDEGNCDEEASEGSSQLDMLLKLCAEVDEQGTDDAGDNPKCEVVISCPLCGADISELSDDRRQIHTNECLDSVEAPAEVRTFASPSLLKLSVELMMCDCSFALLVCTAVGAFDVFRYYFIVFRFTQS